MNHSSERLVARRFDGLLPPLQHPLGLGERALLLHVGRGREEEHLGAALLGHDLAGLDLRGVLPERGRLDHREVADDQPVELGHGEPHQPPVGHRRPRGSGRTGSSRAPCPSTMSMRGAEDAVVAVDAREVVEAEVVVGGGALAPVLLQQRDQVRVGGVPEALLLAAADRRDVRVEVRGGGRGHRQVAGQQVEQRGDVGAALDAGVAAQGEDPAAGAADVAQQELHDRPGADVLRAHAVLGPAHAVDQRGGAFPAGVGRPGVADRAERVLRHAADLLDELRRVAREVPFEDLVDAVAGAAASGRSPRRAAAIGAPPAPVAWDCASCGRSSSPGGGPVARYCQLSVS